MPELHEADDKSTIPYIRMMACKCTQGDLMASTPTSRRGEEEPHKWKLRPYFDKYHETQIKRSVPGMNYPQIVDMVLKEKL